MGNRFVNLIKVPFISALASGLVACSGVHSNSAIVTKCTEDFGDADACLCSAEKFKKYVGSKNYGRYTVFLEVFFVERENTRKYGEVDTAYVAWSGAMERYAKDSGEDRLDVMGDMTGMSSRHNDAMQACGLNPYGEADE